jgi:hypothetical protein
MVGHSQKCDGCSPTINLSQWPRLDVSATVVFEGKKWPCDYCLVNPAELAGAGYYSSGAMRPRRYRRNSSGVLVTSGYRSTAQ